MKEKIRYYSFMQVKIIKKRVRNTIREIYIKKIVMAFKVFHNIEGYCCVVNNRNLEDMEFDLSVSRYTHNSISEDKKVISIFDEMGIVPPTQLKMVPLLENAEVSSGVPNHYSGYYNRKTETRFPYIRIGDINNGTIEIKNIRYLETKSISNLCKYQIKENDILISIAGTIGKIAIVNKKFEGSIASEQLAIIRLKNNSIDSKYLFHILSSSYIHNMLQEVATGLTIRHRSIIDEDAEEFG